MIKILIIEDEEPIRRVLTRIISEESDQYKVTEAENGSHGLALIEQNSFDLVLCDIKMPKMDGNEVLEKSKSLKPGLPFIMLTGCLLYTSPSPRDS